MKAPLSPAEQPKIKLRFEATVYAGIPEIPAMIHEFKGEDEVLEWQLVENLHRRELSDLERSDAYAQLVELQKKRHPEKPAIIEVATRIEQLTDTRPAIKAVKSYVSVAKRLKEATRTANRLAVKKARNLKIRHLQQLSRVEDENIQAELAERAIEENWTVQKLKQKVDKALGVEAPTKEVVKQAVSPIVRRAKENYPSDMVDDVYEYVTSESKLMPTLKALCEMLWKAVKAKGEEDVERIILKAVEQVSSP